MHHSGRVLSWPKDRHSSAAMRQAGQSAMTVGHPDPRVRGIISGRNTHIIFTPHWSLELASMNNDGDIASIKLCSAWRGFSRLPSSSGDRAEEHTSELQSRGQLVCRLLREKKTRNLDNLGA